MHQHYTRNNFFWSSTRSQASTDEVQQHPSHGSQVLPSVYVCALISACLLVTANFRSRATYASRRVPRNACRTSQCTLPQMLTPVQSASQLTCATEIASHCCYCVVIVEVVIDRFPHNLAKFAYRAAQYQNKLGDMGLLMHTCGVFRGAKKALFS